MPALKSGTKTIVLSEPQTAPANARPDRVAIVTGDPPLTGTFFNSLPERNPIHCQLGEQTGVTPSLVPVIGFPTESQSPRRKNCLLPSPATTYATNLPSGEIANTSSNAFAADTAPGSSSRLKCIGIDEPVDG